MIYRKWLEKESCNKRPKTVKSLKESLVKAWKKLAKLMPHPVYLFIQCF